MLAYLFFFLYIISTANITASGDSVVFFPFFLYIIWYFIIIIILFSISFCFKLKRATYDRLLHWLDRQSELYTGAQGIAGFDKWRHCAIQSGCAAHTLVRADECVC